MKRINDIISVEANGLIDDVSFLIQFPDTIDESGNTIKGEYRKVSLGILKEYLGIDYEYSFITVDNDGTITLPDSLESGEYTLIYEDSANNQLSNFAEIGKIEV